MFPKQTQLQNNTLAIHVQRPILSFVTERKDPDSCKEAFSGICLSEDIAGAGTMSGLMPSKTIVPATPTVAERKKPVFDLSIRYHRTGLARANVKETCRVDCQGSFL